MTTLPIIHMNGTSPERLFEQYEAAYYKIGHAIDALGAVEFNQRDYYPGAPGLWTDAVKQHRAWVEGLNRAENEIGEILLHLHEDIGKRKPRAS